MENEITSIEKEATLSITSDGRTYLNTTAKWATFLAILGFIGSGILVFVGVIMLVISPMMKSGSSFGFPTGVLGLIYLPLAVLYAFPSYYLYSFATKIKSALYNNRQAELDESLKNLKRTFKFLGIMTIVMIAAYLIMIPVIFILGFSRVGMMH